jgi:hypothetical protein
MKVPTRQRRTWFGITKKMEGKRFLGERLIEEKIAVPMLPKKLPRIK